LIPLRFLLNWKYQGPNAPFLLAQDRGWFRDAGLDVRFDIGEGSSAIPPALAAGTCDAGFGDLNALIELKAKDPAADATTVFNIYSRAPMCVVSLKDRALTVPAQLAGRRLCSPPFDTGFRMFPAFARAAGLDPATVTLVPGTPAERDQRLLKGEVDGAMGFDATIMFAMRALGHAPDEFAVLYYGDHGFDVYSSAVMVAPSFARRHPAAVRGLLAAINRAWLEALRDPGPAVAAVLARDPALDGGIVRDHLRWVLEHQLVTDESRRLGLGAMDPARITRNATMLMEAFGLPAAPDAAALYDASFLPPAAERALA
jgi:NitT/TauT family transport system substrate-binding protein